MQLKATAKINLGLDVTGVRDNGYHDVCMVMQSLHLHDIVTLEPIRGNGDISLTTNLPYIPTNHSNIAYKAAEALMKAHGVTDGLRIHLEKKIPVAAGLAGGSADAAAVLFGVNRLFDLGLNAGKLRDVGLTIGADVPFCLMRGTALAEGIGEELTVLPSMPHCGILLAKPSVGVSTKKVYDDLDSTPIESHPDIKAIREALASGRLKDLCRSLGNVLERVTIPQCPIIDELKQAMIKVGAMNALMSGSGPTVYGIFHDRADAVRACAVLRNHFNDVRFIVTTPFNRGGKKHD